MKKLLLFSFLFLTVTGFAQVFNGTWKCDYATIDEQPNSTGYNTISLGVVKPNHFVALCLRTSNSTSYLVGYKNADSVNGRMGYYNYAPAGYRMQWTSGFDLVEMKNAMDIVATPDSLIYVANNDPERNILVFKMGADSVYSTQYRLATNADSLHAIDIDGSGRVYVSRNMAGQNPKIYIYKSIASEPEWGNSHASTPLRILTLPETGEVRGIAVNPEGTVLYVSNYTKNKIYCYVGSPAAGYNLYNGFNFSFNDSVYVNGTDTVRPGPWGMKFLKNKNVLSVACAANYKTGAGYKYGRIFFLNPNTGASLDTIDCAEWNFAMTGGYNLRAGGVTPGNVSGYASPYHVEYDNQEAFYTVSHYGWTVDKWSYSGVIPTIPLTITGISKDETSIPSDFELYQNYPNPFNPSTSIKFSVAKTTPVSLMVYNISGELVTELISGNVMNEGTYTISFNASKLASGTYFYKLVAGTVTLTKKMTILK